MHKVETIVCLIKQWDQDLFILLNQWNHPLLDLFFKRITHTLFWLPLYIFLFFFIKKRIGLSGVALFLAMLTLSDQCVAGFIRPLLGRLRPCYAADIACVHLVGVHTGMYGFPSAHASNTFAFAMLFWKLFKQSYTYRYLFFIWAALVSYGRIYGGMHYPLDVGCGALLGVGIGMAMYQVYKKVNSPKNTLAY
ncbi:MAG: phosphatase PAP2 family protein [Candidatus Cardinium sp.]|nr:phosphatase PAP2 family protein [Candidatus Cardinium sp.]